MKRKHLIIIILFFLIILCSLKFSWKTVYIKRSDGTFKVPRAWIVTQKENVIYLTDKPIEEEGYKIYLISDKIGDNGEYIPHYKFFENVEYLKSGRGAIYSLESGYGLDSYNINGKTEERFEIHFANHDKYIFFLVWDNSINERTVKKIAKSWRW